MSDPHRRHEEAFAKILESIPRNDESTFAIVKALQVIALELSELNVSASALIKTLPDDVDTIARALEKESED